LHLLFTSRVPVQRKVQTTIDLKNAIGRFAQDDSVTLAIASAAISTHPGAWVPVLDYASAWVEPESVSFDATSGRHLVGLELRARPQLAATRYRIDLVSTGRPRWIHEYDAPEHGDGQKTFGLTALFAHLQPSPTTLARIYVSVY
jgi:hypothetical protein